MKRQLSTLLLSSLLACPMLTGAASADTASFVAANRSEISGEVSELSHVLLIQIPRAVVLDVVVPTTRGALGLHQVIGVVLTFVAVALGSSAMVRRRV